MIDIIFSLHLSGLEASNTPRAPFSTADYIVAGGLPIPGYLIEVSRHVFQYINVLPNPFSARR
jgi:hypothetical protein